MIFHESSTPYDDDKHDMLCRDPKAWSGPLFWFPANVNAVNARFTALLVVAVCIPGIILRKNEIMRYAIAAMTVDFILRSHHTCNYFYLFIYLFLLH